MNKIKISEIYDDFVKEIDDLRCENSSLNYKLSKKETQQKEFIKYLEDEKDRLIKETSHYYIDSFDRQHAVNEDIFDEVNDILQKYKRIIGVSDENNIK